MLYYSIIKNRSYHLKNTATIFLLPWYPSLDCLTRNSRRAAAIITNSLSREFPRKRPQPGFNGSIRMFRQHDVWANGRAVPPTKFSSLLAQVPMEGALPRHRRDKTCAFALFLDAQVAKWLGRAALMHECNVSCYPETRRTLH